LTILSLIVPTLQRGTQCLDASASRVAKNERRPDTATCRNDCQTSDDGRVLVYTPVNRALALNGTLERPGNSVPRWSVGTICEEICRNRAAHLLMADGDPEIVTAQMVTP